MAHKIYFLGAGLSKSLEKPEKPIPLMFDFVSTMADHLDNQVILATLTCLELADIYEWKSEEAAKIAEEVSCYLHNGAPECPAELREQFRCALKNRPSESIEDLLEKSLKPPAKPEADFYAGRASGGFKSAINQLFYGIGWDVNWRPLEKFLQKQFQGDDSHTFVSFNYDLLLDRAIQKCASDWNVQSGYGFAIDYFLPLDPQGSTVQFPKAERFHSAATAKVSILKPHGSLNWLVPENTSEYGPGGTGFKDGPVTVPLSCTGKLSYFGSTEPFKWISFDNQLTRNRGVEIYIIPPVAAAKSQSTHFIKQVREREEEAIADADEVYIIGWSLPETDKDQESLIRCSLGKRQRAIGSLTVVNHGARPAYFRRVADVFGVPEASLKIFNGGFEAFVGDL